MTVVFPDDLMREQGSSWRLQGSMASPGQTASGAYPLVRLDGGGLWRCDYTGIALNRQPYRQLWRATEALLDGGSVPCIVPTRPFCSHSDDGVPHSDDSPHSDGEGYAQPTIAVVAATNAAQRATSITVTVLDGDISLQEFFSIEHETLGWRLYQIAAMVENDEGDVEVTFRPPLREDVASGDTIECDQPRCTMRLLAPGAMDLTLSQRRFGSPSVSFVETFTAS